MKISFIIPFHNEEKNAGPMIEQVTTFAKKQKWDFEIIPVNDRSTDTTQEVLEKYAKRWNFVHPITRKNDTTELGNTMGKALLAGTHKATGDMFIWTMGDLADRPQTYKDMVEKVQKGYDMVFGSRYMPGGSWGNLDVFKARLSSWGTLLARIMFGVPVHDITNAFRCFKRNVFDAIRLDAAGFDISPEFALKAHLSGFTLGEVPTIYFNRVEGVSSFKLWNMTLAYLRVYVRLFQAKINGKPYDWEQ